MQTLPGNFNEVAGYEDACQEAKHNPSDEKEETNIWASAWWVNEWIQANLDMLLRLQHLLHVVL